MQRSMGEFFRQGHYRQHLERVEKTLSYRRDRLRSLVDGIGHLHYSPHQAGFSLWIKSDKPLSSSPVPWSRGENFSFNPQARDCFRLSFMHMSDAIFEDGVAYLAPLLAGH
jgi:DNA-binding transcriptional MocR family regulator